MHACDSVDANAAFIGIYIKCVTHMEMESSNRKVVKTCGWKFEQAKALRMDIGPLTDLMEKNRHLWIGWVPNGSGRVGSGLGMEYISI